MRAQFVRMLLIVAVVFAPGVASAWSNHGFMAWWAFSQMPEVTQAAPAKVEPLEAFLRDQQPAIAALLEGQEKWARENVTTYPPRPDELAFKPDSARDDAALRLAFLHALRVAANMKFALFVQPDPSFKPDPARLLRYSDVNTLHEPAFTFHRFYRIEPGETVSALTVLASSADEPDFGMDINCWDDNPADWGKLYHFGKQPFGNPALDFSSQAPFHMGFFHQSGIIYRAAPFVARTYPVLRAHQFFGLAQLAFRSGHAYWGWRFAGNALHYVQDLTQPYHANLLPGVSTARMIMVALAAKLGWPGLQNDLTVLVSNRHLVLERYQSQMLFRTPPDGAQAPVLKALQSGAHDADYPAWSDTYLRDVASAQAFEFGERINDALLAAMPAHYVSDPTFDFGAHGGAIDLIGEAAKGDLAPREKLESLIVDVLDHFGAHSRNLVRGLLRETKDVPTPRP